MPFMQRSLTIEHSNLLKIQPCQPKERKPSHELCVITNRVIPLKPGGDLLPQSFLISLLPFNMQSSDQKLQEALP